MTPLERTELKRCLKYSIEYDRIIATLTHRFKFRDITTILANILGEELVFEPLEGISFPKGGSYSNLFLHIFTAFDAYLNEVKLGTLLTEEDK
jgi:hypothetical protein